LLSQRDISAGARAHPNTDAASTARASLLLAVAVKLRHLKAPRAGRKKF
jgi:hypothetical protein